MWILIIVLFLCIYKIIDCTRELQELRGETQRLQEDAGRRQTQAKQDHRKVQALEDSAKELQDGLEAISSRSKAKDAVIASFEERLKVLIDEKKQLAKAKDQALLDAKRALSSIGSSSKDAKDAIHRKELAEADRDIAYKQMEEALETAARAEAECAAAQAAQAEAEAARDAALEAQKATEEIIKAANKLLESKHIALIEALKRAETAETSRETEVGIWKQRTAETEKNLVAEQDKIVATQKQFSNMVSKFAEVDAGYGAILDQVKMLEKELKISRNEADNLRNQLQNELKNNEEAQNKAEEAVKEQKRLELELIAAQEAAVQSAEDEILSVRRELEASVADSDGEIKSLKAQLQAATFNAEKSADESAERLQQVDEELENLKMTWEKTMQETNRLRSAVAAAETELESTKSEVEKTRNAQFAAVSNAKDELNKEIQLEISRREEAEKNLENLKIELEAANNARDSAQAEIKDLEESFNVAAELRAKASATIDAGNSLDLAILLEELEVLRKKNVEHEEEIAALLDAKASAEIKLEDAKKSNQREIDNLRELNRRLLSREKSAKQTTITSGGGGGGRSSSSSRGGSNISRVEEGSQSPAMMKASTDMTEKLDTLKRSTDKLFSTHRSSPASPGGRIYTTVPSTTPTRSPLSRSTFDTKTP
ncbi:hypothetical protein Ndes2437B_g05867 [Nannochloris sp. 'desiccata']